MSRPLTEERGGRRRLTPTGRAIQAALVQPAARSTLYSREPPARPDPISEYLRRRPQPRPALPLGYTAEPLLTADEQRLVRDALELADVPELVAELLFRVRHGRLPGQSPDAALGLVGPPTEWEAEAVLHHDLDSMEQIRGLIAPEVAAYDAKVEAEFNGLESFVRPSFGWDPGKTALEKYREMRPVYCRAGFANPKTEIFDELVDVQFLAPSPQARRLPGGVQPEIADKLAGLHEALSALDPALADSFRPRLLGGFVPRRVAGTKTLSDHALGLAVDLNWDRNPHIKGAEMIRIVKEATAGAPGAPADGYDFGKPFGNAALEASDRTAYIRDVHAISTAAGAALQAWIGRALARESEILELIEIAKALLADRQTERRATRAGTAARALADQRIGEARAELTAAQELLKEPDVRRLRTLRTLVPGGNATERAATLRSWATNGVRDLPLELVVAMTAVGLTWGDEWKGHKDGMHFDLGRPAVREVRTLEGLLAEYVGPGLS